MPDSTERAKARPPAVIEPRDWAEIGRAYGLLLLSAVMMFLGFAGFGLWPFAFVGMVPALFVMDARPGGMKLFWRAIFFGYVAFYGGFYWVVNTIVDFGGFPYPLALLFASIYFFYQALQYVLMLWLYRRARDRGFGATLSLVVAFLAAELVFPQLFDNFYGNSFHMLPTLIQVADLGGPMMLSALSMLGNGAAYVLLRAFVDKEPPPRVAPAVFAGVLALYLGYGVWRTSEVEARMALADAIHIGVVQTNMGIYEKREDPGEGLRRHLEQSLELESRGELDLLVWPESAAVFRLPRDLGVAVHPFFDRALAFYGLRNPGSPHTPLIFGGLSSETVDGQRRLYNTAFITDAEGRVQAHYDKTYLLAFGEYIPFGEMFPQLYDYSPNTGHFTPGDHVRSLPFGEYQIGTLVCYEDILPTFVRSMMSEGEEPNLLVNITNDAWFGETQEPYVHLALAKMRAVEHHRFLVRATNTGVSAIIDPLGRVTEEGGLFERSSLYGEVRMMSGGTVYRSLGNWPGWLALAAMIYIGLIGRRREPERPAEARNKEPKKKEEEE